MNKYLYNNFIRLTLSHQLQFKSPNANTTTTLPILDEFNRTKLQTSQQYLSGYYGCEL
jgi:hypothetical protein